MARGFLSGVVWGGVVSVVGAGVLSVLTEGPMAPDVIVSAPQATTAPTTGDPSTADAVTDADLVLDAEVRQSTSPQADDVTAAVAAGSDTPTIPQTGGAEGLGGPARTVTNAGVGVLDETPVLPSSPVGLPAAPDSEQALAISTDPAQPPAPIVPEIESAFADPGDPPEIGGNTAQPQSPTGAEDTGQAQAQAPTVTEAADTDVTEAQETETQETVSDPVQPDLPPTPTAPEPSQDDSIAALPPALDLLPSTDEGPTIGRKASSLVDRSSENSDGPVAEDGLDLPPIDAFAAPFENADGKPLMAIVLIDNGVDLTGGPVGLAALDSFPYPLSFAVDASLPDAGRRIADYRAQGFEVMLTVDLPQGATASDVETTLSAVLADRPEVVAIMEGTGVGLQGSREASDQITEALRATGHGLVLQSKGLNTAQKLAVREGVPTGLVFRDFDSADQTPAAIRRFLDQAAFRAGQEGGVIMVGRVRSDTITALLLWGLQDRAERVALAPISTVLRTLSADP